MPFQQVPNTAKVAIEGRLQGEPAVLTTGFTFTEAPDADDVEQLAVALSSNFILNGIPNLPERYTFEQVVVTSLHAQIAPTFTDDSASGTEGTLQGASCPNNVTLCVSFRTGQTGRSARGRNYWPGFLEIEEFDNRISEARANAIAGFYETMMGAGTLVAGWTWVVISRRINGAIRPTGVVYPITQVVITDTIVDSQRRRLPGRGA